MCKPRFEIILKSGSLASGDREAINYNGENMKTNEQLRQFTYGFIACGLTVALIYLMWGAV